MNKHSHKKNCKCINTAIQLTILSKKRLIEEIGMIIKKYPGRLDLIEIEIKKLIGGKR